MKLSGTLVFSSGKSGDFDIWTYELTTQEFKQLTYGDYWNDSPKWSPDGNRIVYVSNRTGVPEIWVMKADGSDQTQLTKRNKYHSQPSWSPDGRKIVCAANYEDADNIDIYVLNADGSGEPELIISCPGQEADPSWSPDGEYMPLPL